MKILVLMLLPFVASPGCDSKHKARVVAQSPATRGKKFVFENLVGLQRWPEGNRLRVHQAYVLEFDAVFLEPVHKPVVFLTPYDDRPWEITVGSFQKVDYQAGDREHITCTVKPLQVGKDDLSLSTYETDSDGDKWRLDWLDLFHITVEE